MVVVKRDSGRRDMLGKRGEEILRAVYTYRYVTALDMCSLFFAPSSIAYVRGILTALAGGGDGVENEYLYRFALGEARAGNRMRVYTLGSRGRDLFKMELGVPVAWYFRPDKVRHLSFGQLMHSLILTRFLIAAAKWARERPDCRLVEMRTCYELGGGDPGVERAGEGKKERTKVIPDGWLLFEMQRSGEWFFSPVMLEIDRGTAYRHKFKEHIATRLEFIKAGGEYARLFGRREVVIAYLTSGDTEGFRESRRRAMCAWAMEVLKERNKGAWAPVFRFAGVSFEEMYEGRVFDEPVWYVPGEERPVGLFEG